LLDCHTSAFCLEQILFRAMQVAKEDLGVDLPMKANRRFSAPAVRYAFGRSAASGFVLLFLAVVSGSGLVAFWLAVRLSPASLAGLLCGVAGWCAASAAAFRYWARSPVGLLAWDGQEWALQLAGAHEADASLPEPPHVLWDLQTTLWIMVKRQRRKPLWLWLDRSTRPERWSDLRRAVYSPAIPEAPSASPITPAASREP
jgi:hypothetical protein